MQKAKKDDWIECVSCRNWLHEFCSPYKHKYVDCGRKLVRDKNSKMQMRMQKISFIVTYNNISAHLVQISCTYIFYSNVSVASLF